MSVKYNYIPLCLGLKSSWLNFLSSLCVLRNKFSDFSEQFSPCFDFYATGLALRHGLDVYFISGSPGPLTNLYFSTDSIVFSCESKSTSFKNWSVIFRPKCA